MGLFCKHDIEAWKAVIESERRSFEEIKKENQRLNITITDLTESALKQVELHNKQVLELSDRIIALSVPEVVKTLRSPLQRSPAPPKEPKLRSRSFYPVPVSHFRTEKELADQAAVVDKAMIANVEAG